MSKHTPGPWLYSFENVDPEWSVVTTPGGAIIANVNADYRQEANARLIATAPDLLAAAKRALAVLKATGESVRPGNALGALDAAIARAEGR